MDERVREPRMNPLPARGAHARTPARHTRTGGEGNRTRPGVMTALGLALPLVLLAACGQSDPDPGHAATDRPADPGTDEATEREVVEMAARTPRLAITYDGGVQVLDAATLELVSDIDLAGANTLADAGDGRHALVSTSGGFQVLDLGTWAEPHGDHAHYYTSDAVLTKTSFPAQRPGHVVANEGRTTLFDDADGQVTVFDSGDLRDEGRDVRTYTTEEPHHGLALELSDGTLVASHGDSEARTGIRVLDAGDAEIAASDQCPGLHGSAVSAAETVVVGCADGVLIYAVGRISKAASPDADGSIGTLSGAPVSAVVLGDYSEGTQVSLIDTASGQVHTVDIPAAYSGASLARGDDGEALVLGTDGQIHVIDPEAREVVTSIPVIEEWSLPEDWQEPRPGLIAFDGSVFVTDPGTHTIHAVDVPTAQVWNTAELDVIPNDLIGISGDVVAEPAEDDDDRDHEHGEDDEYEHGDHDPDQDSDHAHDDADHDH